MSNMSELLPKLARKLAKDGPVRVMPTSRMIRIIFGGEYIVKTTKGVLVWEHPYYPQLYIPVSELSAPSAVKSSLQIGQLKSFRSPTDESVELACQVTLRTTKRSTDHVIAFPEAPPAPAAKLAGLVRIDFDAMDQWFEEEDLVYVHFKDPFKRIDILSSTRPIRIRIQGQVVATTGYAAHLYETGLPTRYYMPFSALDASLLRPSQTRTRCPYKGEAEYYSMEVGGKLYEDVIWYYQHPVAESAKIEGLYCFYNEKVQIELDGEVLQPPATFFGKHKPSENVKPSAV